LAPDALARIVRTSCADRLSTITGLDLSTETTPIAAPFWSMIGDPDIPVAKYLAGSNVRHPVRRVTRPSSQRPPSESTRGRAFAGRRVLNLILLGRTAALRSPKGTEGFPSMFLGRVLINPIGGE
jgi:hypothetical protein